ncbi:hypothetical protein ACIPLC_15710 [Kitasatospora sp. NPDC086801]|uniref:hypothetical protein n=1 Tax=unclassified Kitasatospora TaxID=2633591 RepID=UPI00382D1A31
MNSLFDPESSLWIIARQSEPDERHHFYLLLDAYAANSPGAPQIVGVHFERDQAAGTIRADMTTEALIPLAQSWLVGRGADPSRVLEPSSNWPEPNDPETKRIEDYLRTFGDHLEVHETYTQHEEPFETWVIATDTRSSADPAPAEVFVWRRPDNDAAYTVRHGQFASLDAAYAWAQDTSAPLPAPARTRAARHSTINTTGPNASSSAASLAPPAGRRPTR